MGKRASKPLETYIILDASIRRVLRTWPYILSDGHLGLGEEGNALKTSLFHIQGLSSLGRQLIDRAENEAVTPNASQ